MRLPLILFTLLFSISSFAELPTIELSEQNGIDLAEITLLGQGVHPRGADSNLSIFMACVAQEKISCAKIRAIVFDSKNNTAQWLGKELEIISPQQESEIVSEEEVQQLVRKKMKFYNKHFHRTYARGAKLAGPVFGGMAGGIFGVLPVMIGAGILTSVVAWPIAVGLFITGGSIMVLGATSSFGIGTSTKYSKALQSKEGWNWSTRSKKISRSEFWDYYRYIQRGYPLHKRLWEK